MKKTLFVVLTAGMLLLACSGVSWAYSFSFTSILASAPGTAEIKVDIWDPSDNSAGNAYFGTGYWGYIYQIKNIDYAAYMTGFAVLLPSSSTSVASVSTPLGWNYAAYPGSFGWNAASGNQLYTGSTLGGFEVKSTHSPDTNPATAWSAFYSPANGTIAGPGSPEPASAVLLGMGLLGVAGRLIRRKFMA